MAEDIQPGDMVLIHYPDPGTRWPDTRHGSIGLVTKLELLGVNFAGVDVISVDVFSPTSPSRMKDYQKMTRINLQYLTKVC